MNQSAWNKIQNMISSDPSTKNPLEETVRSVISAIGDDPDREGLQETPKRVIKSWKTLFGGYYENPQKVLKVFNDANCDQMVILKDIEFYSTCEHHMLPFFGKAHIAYIPRKGVVGLSKLARLLEVYARRLQVQERLTNQIADALMENLDPKGCGVMMQAKHFCMISRGVNKQNSEMVTTALRGEFYESEVRQEFLKGAVS